MTGRAQVHCIQNVHDVLSSNAHSELKRYAGTHKQVKSERGMSMWFDELTGCAETTANIARLLKYQDGILHCQANGVAKSVHFAPE